MISQKKILLLEITLCILVVATLLYTAIVYYAGAYRINTLLLPLLNWVVVTLVMWKQESNKIIPKLRWFTALLVVATLVVFVAYRPDISYTKGKDIVASHGYENIYELQAKSILSFRLTHTHLVPNAYLYAGEKDNIKYYILLSPIDGEIETETIGDGNYIDGFFEMRYGT